MTVQLLSNQVHFQVFFQQIFILTRTRKVKQILNKFFTFFYYYFVMFQDSKKVISLGNKKPVFSRQELIQKAQNERLIRGEF